MANPVFDMAAVVTSVVRQAETFVTSETSTVGLTSTAWNMPSSPLTLEILPTTRPAGTPT